MPSWQRICDHLLSYLSLKLICSSENNASEGEIHLVIESVIDCNRVCDRV